MPIEFRCPVCRKLLRVPEDTAGRQAQCPVCAHVITIPSPVPQPEKSEIPEGALGGPSWGPEGTPEGGSGAGFSGPVPPGGGEGTGWAPSESGLGAPVQAGYPSDFARSRDWLYAQTRVSGPAICLIVLSILSIVVLVLYLFLWIAGISLLGTVVHDQPGGPPDDEVLGFLFQGAFNLIATILSLAVQIFILLAALKMKELRNYGWAMTAAILCLVPCTSPCCCLIGIPIGIWMLTVLNDPRVKNAFR